MNRVTSLLPAERIFATNPENLQDTDLTIIGSGLGLYAAQYLTRRLHRVGLSAKIVVLDSGPFDHLTHLANTSYPRVPFLRDSAERIGGKLTLWGMSAPRPPECLLRQWPYAYDDLSRRFTEVEELMGVSDPTPFTDGPLEHLLMNKLLDGLPNHVIRSAPLAINRDGHRWSSVDAIPALVSNGLTIVPRFKCTGLHRDDRAARWRIHGEWRRRAPFDLNSKFVFIATGVEAALPLMKTFGRNLTLQTADHIRIDAHGQLERPSQLANFTNDEIGIAVILVEATSKISQVPFHLEVKVAPCSLWHRGLLPSGDNLRDVQAGDNSMWAQVQVIAAMHDRFPSADLLRVPETIPPVMSRPDAYFHGQLVQEIQSVAELIGLSEPTFSFRPLTHNHHLYGSLRVGKHVTPNFQMCGHTGTYVLPPTAYVDIDDDANPTLKSAVLTQFACDDVLSQLMDAA